MASTPRVRALARLLKRAQEHSGLSVRTIAERLNWSRSRVSRIQNVAQGITEADVSAFLAIVGVTGPDRDQLLRMVRDLNETMWWEVHKNLPHELSGLIDAEQRASRLICVSPTVVPGLLQTRAYSRATFEWARMSVTEVDQAVALRQTRQGVLDRTDAVELVAYIDEPVLWRPVRRSDVRTDQLDYLCKLATRPNITVRIIPLDADLHLGLNGLFTILEFEHEDSLVFTEAANAGATLTGHDDVKAFYDAVARLSEVALGPDDSAQLIARYSHEGGAGT